MTPDEEQAEYEHIRQDKAMAFALPYGCDERIRLMAEVAAISERIRRSRIDRQAELVAALVEQARHRV